MREYVVCISLKWSLVCHTFFASPSLPEFPHPHLCLYLSPQAIISLQSSLSNRLSPNVVLTAITFASIS